LGSVLVDLVVQILLEGMALEHCGQMSINNLDQAHVLMSLFRSHLEALLGPHESVLLGFLEEALHGLRLSVETLSGFGPDLIDGLIDLLILGR
jgi:hypothetical protein